MPSHAKEWNFNTSKTAEAVILLDLIATLRAKAKNTNQGKVEVHTDNKDTGKRVSTTTRVVNNFNYDSTSETIFINKLMKEVDLDRIDLTIDSNKIMFATDSEKIQSSLRVEKEISLDNSSL